MEIDKPKILNIVGNLLEYTQDATRSGLYAQTQDTYKEEHLKMRDKAYNLIQINLADLADVLNIERKNMPGLLPEYWGNKKETK